MKPLRPFGKSSVLVRKGRFLQASLSFPTSRIALAILLVLLTASVPSPHVLFGPPLAAAGISPEMPLIEMLNAQFPRMARARIGHSGTYLDNGGYLIIGDDGDGSGTISNAVLQQGSTGKPAVDLPLSVNPSEAYPGCYLADVALAPGARPGIWGLEVLTTAGKRELSGGLNFGGVVDVNEQNPAWGAFNFTNPTQESQEIRLRLDAQALPTPGYSAGNLGLRGRILDVNQVPLDQGISGRPPLQMTRMLKPGFYIVEVTTLTGSPRATFQLAAETSFVDRAGGGFQGGVAVGGHLHYDDSAQSLHGFAAFCLSEAQTVQFKTYGGEDYGTAGAGDLVLTLFDSMNHAVWSSLVPATTTSSLYPSTTSTTGTSTSTTTTTSTTGSTTSTNTSTTSTTSTTTTTEPPDPDGTWRSGLYPRGWRPIDDGGAADAEGRFLHDFSYAGYHRGEMRPPYGEGSVVARIDPALGDGVHDATAGIQAALDSACNQGGGVVWLPAGTYRIRLPSAAAFSAIVLGCSRLVLRGDGPGVSRILFDDPLRARQKAAIAMRSPRGSFWESAGTITYALASDAPAATRTITLVNARGLAVGDWIIVRNDVTPAFRAEHRMNAGSTGESQDFWPSSSFRGIAYPRRITSVRGNQVELDAPTRYLLRTRDAARVYVLKDFIEESGMEDLGIGMVENTTTPPGGSESSHDEEYDTPDTTAYQVHASRAIDVDRAHNCWLYNVHSFIPSENTASSVHLLSCGIQLGQGTFRMRIDGCELGRPEYRGGGGNGYLFHIQGNDNLLVDLRATNARHGFIFNQATSGNVFLRGTMVNSRLTDDAHRFLSHANLYDGVTLDGAWLSAVNRGSTSSGGGFTATAHVFWNTLVLRNHSSAKGCAIETAQWAYGYAMGTRAPAGQSAKVCTSAVTNSYWATLDQGAPIDFVEGEGQGARLHPQSLYASQRARRCAAPGITCDR